MKTACCGRHEPALNRRDFLVKSAFGFGACAFGSLLARERALGAISPNPLAPKPPPVPARARNVIFFFMQGGPSHVDTFDPKPELTRYDGKPLPDSFKTEGLSLQFMKATDGKLMGSPFAFKKCGQSGLEISARFINVSRFADNIAVIRSCYHEPFIHGPALGLLQTGSVLLGHPSVGSWVLYEVGC